MTTPEERTKGMSPDEAKQLADALDTLPQSTAPRAAAALRSLAEQVEELRKLNQHNHARAIQAEEWRDAALRDTQWRERAEQVEIMQEAEYRMSDVRQEASEETCEVCGGGSPMCSECRP